MKGQQMQKTPDADLQLGQVQRLFKNPAITAGSRVVQPISKHTLQQEKMNLALHEPEQMFLYPKRKSGLPHSLCLCYCSISNKNIP
ncbi:hypothetical protein [Bacillus sp. SJS]|nr:hypothetical protein [Bacillus sp. SJS]